MKAQAQLFLAGLLGPVVINLIIIVILIILFFIGRNIIINNLETFLPPDIARAGTNVAFGILLIYFAIRMFKR